MPTRTGFEYTCRDSFARYPFLMAKRRRHAFRKTKSSKQLVLKTELYLVQVFVLIDSLSPPDGRVDD